MLGEIRRSGFKDIFSSEKVGLLIQGRVGVVGQVTTFYNRQCVIPFASIKSHTVTYSMLNSMYSISFSFPSLFLSLIDFVCF